MGALKPGAVLTKTAVCPQRNAKIPNLCTPLQRALAPEPRVTQIFFTSMYFLVQYSRPISPGSLHIYQYYGYLFSSSLQSWGVIKNIIGICLKCQFLGSMPRDSGMGPTTLHLWVTLTHSFRTPPLGSLSLKSTACVT